MATQHPSGAARARLGAFETKDRALAAEALVAGLLHDLGTVVLATNFDDLYGRVHSLARKQPIALWDIEKEMFGASHGEIGGCMVGMWNMPSSAVEAAAFDHAYGGEGKGDVKCTVDVREGEITVILQDGGQPFNPEKIASPNLNIPLNKVRSRGAGLYLIRKMMDKVHYESKPGSGNILTMQKRRS